MAGFSNSITITAFFFLASVIAGPVLEPQITAPPLLRRNSPDFIGYYADGVVSGSTICMLERYSQSGTPHINIVSTTGSEESCNPGYTVFSAGSYFKCCSIGGACHLFTGCSGSILLGQNTQLDWYCTLYHKFHFLTFEFSPYDYGSSYPYCSSDLLYQSSGALAASTYYWCAKRGETGSFYYAESPGGTCICH
jgi:hypothetical protein